MSNFLDDLTHLDHAELVEREGEEHDPVVDEGGVGVQVALAKVVLGAAVDLRPHDVVDHALDLGRVDVHQPEGRDVRAAVLDNRQDPKYVNKGSVRLSKTILHIL